MTKLLFSFLLVLTTSFAYAKDHVPEALDYVVDQVELSARGGHKPVVIFDIDDTLINTRGRNIRIIKDFIAQADIQSRFPAEAALAAGVQLKHVRYLLSDTLKGLGVANEEFVKLADEFWLPRFFSDRYSARDEQIRKAARYVQSVVRAGGTVVYLSGRDVPRMEIGTVYSLRTQFFPTAAPQARLMLKPSKDVDDLEFKRQAIASITALGEVVAIFENEPANLNALAAAFPRSIPIFVDTIHSPKPDVPLEAAYWVKNFVY